jgi:hypothetical protein
MKTNVIRIACCSLASAIAIAGCGAAPRGGVEQENTDGTARLALTATGTATHAVYRLGPASFRIEGDSMAPLVLSAEGSEATLDVPLGAGAYRVTLEQDWVLQQSFQSSPFAPVEATLMSKNPQDVFIEPLHATDVSFDFALGESKLRIGIGVDEGDHRPPGYIPEGYDGAIELASNGQHQIVFAAGGEACCWSTAALAQAAYPDKKLIVRE